MTSQDFGSLLSLVNTDALTSYDVDLEKRTCSRCPWQVTGRDPVCTRPNGFEIEKTSKKFCHEYFHLENFRSAYGELFHQLTNMDQRIKAVKGIVVHLLRQQRQFGCPRV